MLNENEKVKGKYKAIDPYIKQSPLKDFSIPNYRQYDETTQEEQEREFQYKVYDYPQYDVEKLRDKRQIDQPRDEEIVYEKFLTPLYVITAVFAAMLIFGPLLVRKGPNRGIVQASIMLSAFCMWIFWFTIYFGQMNPLMGPRLENTTVAWIAYKLGNPFKNTSL